MKQVMVLFNHFKVPHYRGFIFTVKPFFFPLILQIYFATLFPNFRMTMHLEQKKRRFIATMSYWLGGILLLLPGFPAEAQPSLTAKIQKLIAQPAYQKTQFSIQVYHLPSKKSLFLHHADQPLIPASNMKLITTAASLDLLGPEFEYETVFALDGDDLVIKASGDPLTGDPVLAKNRGENILDSFDQVAIQLKKVNRKVIPGDLVIDATIFDDQRFHPSWPKAQADKWYTAQIDALNFNNNCLDISFVPSASEKKLITYSISPRTSYANITNKCVTTHSEKNVIGASRVLNTNNITLRGRCRYEQTIYVTIDRPSAFFGHVLAEVLLANGLSINGKMVILDKPKKKADDFQIIYTYRTPIHHVLKRCNQKSLNMAAESLFKTVGAFYANQKKLGQPGTWPTGRLAVQAFLEKCNVSPDQFSIDDGSGLSAANRLSAHCITSVLIGMYNHPAFETYRNSLSTPQVGTLKKSRRFSEPKYQDRLFAKTGYISKAWALSGYCKNKSDQWLAFSIIANKGKKSPRNLIDQIVKAMMN
jgi:D-alanyl-D-alanine carboxypeptidase/D-alanyl-D-alanine-endopeptidase (penicillin-binding protein 4)